MKYNKCLIFIKTTVLLLISSFLTDCLAQSSEDPGDNNEVLKSAVSLALEAEILNQNTCLNNILPAHTKFYDNYEKIYSGVNLRNIGTINTFKNDIKSTFMRCLEILDDKFKSGNVPGIFVGKELPDDFFRALTMSDQELDNFLESLEQEDRENLNELIEGNSESFNELRHEFILPQIYDLNANQAFDENLEFTIEEIELLKNILENGNLEQILKNQTQINRNN